MPTPWQRTSNVAPIADTTLVTTAETVVATLPGISTQSADAIVRLTGQALVTLGTATTALVVRIRQGSLTGTVVGESEQPTAGVSAGNPFNVDINMNDTPGEVASLVYVLTIAQIAATGNGTCIDAALSANVG